MSSVLLFEMPERVQTQNFHNRRQLLSSHPGQTRSHVLGVKPPRDFSLRLRPRAYNGLPKVVGLGVGFPKERHFRPRPEHFDYDKK
jgi:hypothetical protein